MHKPFVLATGVALIFLGCQSKSPTWQKVVATPRAVGDAENRPRAFAGELHEVLGATPHKVVTYEFDYTSQHFATHTGQRTAVIYRDPAHGKQPWWGMDYSMHQPVWLPDEPLERQVQFLVRRPARILEVQDFTESREREVVIVERKERRSATSSIQRAEPVPTVKPVRAPKARVVQPVLLKKDEPVKKRRMFWQRREAEQPNPVVTRAVSRIEPAPGQRAPKARVIAKPAEKPAKKTAPNSPPKRKSAVRKASAPSEKKAPESQPVEALEIQPVPAEPTPPAAPTPAPEPKKKPPLFHRDEKTPQPTAPTPAEAPSARAPRPNLLERLFGRGSRERVSDRA